MIIKKYTLYKESNNTDMTLVKFINDLLDICNMMTKKNDNNSMLWATSLSKLNRDPQSDLNIFKQRMLGKGWDKEVIIHLFNTEDITRRIDNEDLNDRFREIGSGDSIYAQNGMIDLFTMWCDSISGKDHDLVFGGVGPGGDSTEAIVRYNYGYHRTKYGKIYVESAFTTIDNFKEKAFEEAFELLDSIINIKYEDILELIEDGYITKNKENLSISLDMLNIYHELDDNGKLSGKEYEEFVEECIENLHEVFESYSYEKTTLKFFI